MKQYFQIDRIEASIHRENWLGQQALFVLAQTIFWCFNRSFVQTTKIKLRQHNIFIDWIKQNFVLLQLETVKKVLGWDHEHFLLAQKNVWCFNRYYFELTKLSLLKQPKFGWSNSKFLLTEEQQHFLLSQLDTLRKLFSWDKKKFILFIEICNQILDVSLKLVWLIQHLLLLKQS